MDPREQLGEAVRRRREGRGFSQERLAERTGLDRTYISSVERGKRNVSLVNICKLAGALYCHPHELLVDVEAIYPT